MPFAPNHDWEFYDQKLAAYHASRCQKLTPAEKFEIYDDYYSTLRESKTSLVDSETLRKNIWEEKLTIRKKLVAAYHALDESLREKDD